MKRCSARSGYAGRPSAATAIPSRSRPTACSRCASSTRSITSKASCSSTTSPSSSAIASARRWRNSGATPYEPDAAQVRAPTLLHADVAATAVALKLSFAGTPDFARVALAALLQSRHEVRAGYTQPDRPAGRGRKLTPSPLKQLAEGEGIEVQLPVSLKPVAEHTRLRAYQADVMVVVAYGLILPQAVLDIPRHGCLNIHASLLTRRRSAAPIQSAQLASDGETSITIIQMNAGLDTGDMLLKRACPIAPADTAQTPHDS